MSPRVRQLAGPVLVGTACWCAAGHLTVAEAGSAVARLAVPAPWWVLPAAILAAAAVPPFRARPRTTLPALLATLPWWPVTLPAAALLFTGPLAWLPVLASVALALPGRAGGRGARGGVGGARLAAALTLAACGISLWATGDRLRGDEPHYLMISQSLLRDADLRIENNHDAREYAPFYRDGRLVPDFTVRGRDGEIYSIHAPGTPVIVLPAYAIAGWRGAQITLLLLSAVTGALVWQIGWRATGAVAAAWFAWAAVVLSPTFLLHASAIFPDAPAALVTALALLISLRLAQGDEVSERDLLLASIALAALPWLHSRLVILAAGFGLLLVAQVRGTRRRLRFLAVPALSALAWFAFFQVIYGTPDPRAPYGGDDPVSVAWVVPGILGLLFDEQFGLLAHAPVLAAALVGFRGGFTAGGPRDAAARRTAWAGGGVVLAYLGVVTLFRMWWAGLPSAPARFLMDVAPLLALPAALAWHRGDAARRALLGVLLALSAGVSVILVASRGALAWNVRDAQPRWLEWLAPVVNLPRALPSFFWHGDAAFVLHLLVTAALLLGSWRLVRLLVGRSHPPGGASRPWRTAAVWWLLVSLPLTATTGWLMTGGPPLDPARSQLAVAAAAASGRPLLSIGAFHGGTGSAARSGLRIQTEQLGTFREQVQALTLEAVPPGRYRITLDGASASSHPLTLTVGDSPAALRAFAPGALSGAGVDLDLAGGASVLVLGSPDPDVDMTGWRLSLAPAALLPGPIATRTQREGSTDVFVRRDAVFLEPGGFWVPGAAAAADVAFAVTAAPLRLEIHNGAAPNTISIAAGDFHWTARLAPDEARPVDIPVPPPGGSVHVVFSCSDGFRPSAAAGDGDRRFLGFWVRLP